MDNKVLLWVWSGERKLLPLDGQVGAYQLRCLKGQGYLRVMSSAVRQSVKSGDGIVINAGEIATLTGKHEMLVEINYMTGQGRGFK